MSDLRNHFLEEEAMRDKLMKGQRLDAEEIALFRKLNLEDMKRDADNLQRAKWLVICVIGVLVVAIVYFARWV